MRCKFCFAGFKDVKKTILPKGHLSKEDCIEVVRLLGHHFKKITFAGGEPTLCPWLPDLIREAKNAGLTTMIVTNGSKLSQDHLNSIKDYLDWIALSIDSTNPETNFISGRTLSGKGMDFLYYKNIGDLIRTNGIRLKINTVVHRKNYEENLSELIKILTPARWKILKVLSVEDQNGLTFKDFEITDEQFIYFLNRNDSTSNMVPETNEDMRGSYLMIDPAGRFFDNVAGKHSYSRPILKDGLASALSDISFDYSKFIGRGGIYNW